ncbi:MAG: hypothetical protein H3C64_08455 [Candidatus Kuenenia stuttgartiensis]|nr:hypothetical protein [Candidatus Kuenenia stuttgartiensis]
MDNIGYIAPSRLPYRLDFEGLYPSQSYIATLWLWFIAALKGRNIITKRVSLRMGVPLRMGTPSYEVCNSQSSPERA